MEIYVVQPGDTIESIAQKLYILTEKLVKDNGLDILLPLVVGQTLVITYPAEDYIVREGDTLDSIAETFQVTVMQLLRNNPEIANRHYIYPGESLVIRYNNDKGNTWVVGYTYPFIRNETLRRTLPYLTYLLIFNYRTTSTGELIGRDEDMSVIQTAKLYDTASTLVLTAYSNIGEINLEVEYEVLLNKQFQDRIIEQLLSILRVKGYNGVNLAFQLINEDNQDLYLSFLTNVSSSLHPAGYSVFLTLNPGLTYSENEITFERINYTAFSNVCDGILFLSYDWGFIDRPPMQYSIVTTKSLLDYIVSRVPLEKIRIEIPTLGYHWELPYIPGETKANALNYDSAIALARQMEAVIKYDETSLSAYFEYFDNNGHEHIVWFKDARSIDASLKILQSYGIDGIGIWNIMYYFYQLWLVINTQYQIEKV